MKRRKNNGGCFKRQLGIKAGDKIPSRLINRIAISESGRSIKNPTQKGFRRIKITPLLIRRAILVQNLRRIRRKR